jgi:REP element-mobilizing transposase RayT
MNEEPPQQCRRSIRLKGFDYSEPGAYFVTIVTQDRSCVFGEIVDGRMRPNSAGEVIECWWLELTRKFQTVETDEFVVMPNHCHGIIVIADSTVGADLCVGPPDGRTGAHAGAPLPRIMQWFKTMTTNEYIRGVKSSGWQRIRGQLWQRNYYDHIIRDDDSLTRIRQYIIDNPAQWESDRENPALTVDKPDAPY